MKELNSTFWVWDLDNQEINVSSTFINKLGLNDSAVTPEKFWENLIHPDSQTVFRQKIEALVSNSEISLFTHSGVLKTKEESKPVKITGEQIGPKLIAGQIKFSGPVNPTQDSHFLDLLMEHLPYSIFFKDRDSRFIKINQACAEKFGLDSPAEALGKTDFDFFEDEHAQAAFNDEQYVIESGNPIIDKVEKEVFSGKGGRVRWASTSKIPMYGSRGEILGTFGITKDITNKKKKQDELSETIDIISHQKNRFQNFAHIVSHNLRNHAGNISMILSLMDVVDSQEEKSELIENLGVASERLNETISDLNDIVDVFSKTTLELKPVSIYTVFQNVKDILSSEIFEHNVLFEDQIPPDLIIEYNPSYMESILLNLISNAIKYRSPDREPVIGLKAFKRDGKTVLSISDNGVGMDLEKYGDDLFGMYKTFHGNSNSKGIGLYLTKNQIESMGGTIQVESKPGEGTTFTIFFGS